VLDALGGRIHFEEDRLEILGVLGIHERRLRVDAERGIFKPRTRLSANKGEPGQDGILRT
jgi:hypothetical protein